MAAQKKPASERFADRAQKAKRESKHVEFKEHFDPAIDGEWCELIKDFIAIGNSGGGVVLIGVTGKGIPSGEDIQPVIELDGATIGDKTVRYTGEHISGFDVQEVRRGRSRVAAIYVDELPTPVAFIQDGRYTSPQGKVKKAFVKGSVYIRHGAKSEPATTTDLREAIDRRVSLVRETWMASIRRVVSAPEGSESAIYKRTGTEKTGEPTAIRLTTEPDAPLYGKLDPDKTHPHRQKELVQEVNRRLDGRATINRYDIDCARRLYNVNADDTPEFFHQPKWSGSPQYSDAFVNWLVAQYERDSQFFAKTRERDLAQRKDQR